MRAGLDQGQLAVAVRQRLRRPGEPLLGPGGVAERPVGPDLDGLSQGYLELSRQPGAVTCGVPSWTVSPAGRSRPYRGCLTPLDRYLIEPPRTAGRRVHGAAGAPALPSRRRSASCGRARRWARPAADH